MAETSTTPVNISVRNTTGLIELNRPSALNALNVEMIEIISEALESWRDDDQVTQVLVYSGVEKGFCSGGDVRGVREDLVDGRVDSVNAFFRAEYGLNHVIANYPKPYAALINGVTMGGGMGISIHGSHRIVTERAFASMPEMAIGFITDVGMTYTLQRLSHGEAVGRFLGLTGFRLKPADLIESGVATHYVESADGLVDKIVGDGLDETLAAHASIPDGESFLQVNAGAINEIFGGDSWAEIEKALDNTGAADFVELVRELTLAASPSSLVATAELFAANSQVPDLKTALDNERRLGELVRSEPDFVEGVRAVLVDKSKDAAFHPSTWSEVDPEPYRRVLNS